MTACGRKLFLGGFRRREGVLMNFSIIMIISIIIIIIIMTAGRIWPNQPRRVRVILKREPDGFPPSSTVLERTQGPPQAAEAMRKAYDTNATNPAFRFIWVRLGAAGGGEGKGGRS